MRLDRLLGNLGYGSRREVKGLVRGGDVRLDGALIDDPEMRLAITPDLRARMTVGTEALDPLPGFVALLNKPRGVTCSHKEAGRLVYELLPPRWRAREPAVSSVGRLDKDTSGLLLLTDDGALLHRIIAPKAAVPKRYRVTLARPLRGNEAAVFAAGTLLLDNEATPLRPATLEVTSPTEANLTVTEGRYHQVRRMFAAVGNHVETLHRNRIGSLSLPDDLAPGALLVMTPEQVGFVLPPRI